jgi:hypothetical protein
MLVSLLHVVAMVSVLVAGGGVRGASCLTACSKYWHKGTYFLCSEFWADWLHLVASFQVFLLDDADSATGGGLWN